MKLQPFCDPTIPQAGKDDTSMLRASQRQVAIRNCPARIPVIIVCTHALLGEQNMSESVLVPGVTLWIVLAVRAAVGGI
eukprot:5310227-Amphidinium_carterae.1